MYNRFSALMLIALLFSLAACKKDDDTPAPAAPDRNESRSFDAGTAIGTPLTFTVSAAGGTCRSADNKLSISIPPGALAAETQISIQPVSNTNPAGTGGSYRLLPHGLQFSKPVTLTLSYDETAAGADPAGLGIFFQNEAGEWRYIVQQNRDAAARTISVTTSHFSDWAIGHWIHLTPQASSILAGERQELKLVSYFDLQGDLAPLTPPGASDIAMGNERPVNPPYFKPGSWKLTGAGTLTSDGSKAYYQSPAQISAPFQATVSVEISNPASPQQQQHILIGTIDVDVPRAAGIYFSVNGGPERYLEASIIPDINPSYLLLITPGSDDIIEINFRNATGTYNWDKEETDNNGYNLVQIAENSQNAYQISAYYDILADGKYTNSSGTISITKAPAGPGDAVEGTFSAGKCARVQNGVTTYATITGHFKGVLE